MKTPFDPRHQKRVAYMQDLFAASFRSQGTSAEPGSILSHASEIDSKIQKAAPEWPVDKIAKIDLAILRLAVYELTVKKTEPPKVIIDEAIELAHEFGNSSSQKFVNGVLGTILKAMEAGGDKSEVGFGQANNNQ